jgi:hypothetical protein
MQVLTRYSMNEDQEDPYFERSRLSHIPWIYAHLPCLIVSSHIRAEVTRMLGLESVCPEEDRTLDLLI